MASLNLSKNRIRKSDCVNQPYIAKSWTNPRLLSFRNEKRIDKIEHEGMGTCAITKISQDADNADEKLQWFLKFHKTYKVLWEAYF